MSTAIALPANGYFEIVWTGRWLSPRQRRCIIRRTGSTHPSQFTMDGMRDGRALISGACT
jgi:hypothetical protein